MRIVATAIAVPEPTESAQDLAARIGRSEDWIREHSGVLNRHVSAAGADPAVLAAQACSAALAQSGGAPPDLIINASSIGRQAIPDTSVFIQRELGLSGIPSFSVNAVMRLPSDPATEPDDFLFHMDGPGVYRFVLRRMGTVLSEFFAACGKTPDDLSLVVPHQASRRAMRLLHHVGFADHKIVDISAQYGNCVAASIPMALAIAHREGRIRENDLVLLLGTSAGVSIGAAMLRW